MSMTAHLHVLASSQLSLLIVGVQGVKELRFTVHLLFATSSHSSCLCAKREGAGTRFDLLSMYMHLLNNS